MAETTKILYSGDFVNCDKLRGFAQLQLDILKNRMTFQNLKQDTSILNLDDGTVIKCSSAFGTDNVEILVPPFKVKEDKIKEDKYVPTDVWLTYNCDTNAQKYDVVDSLNKPLDTEGWAFDIDNDKQIGKYDLNIPATNGDPLNWDVSKDSRLNVLKSYTYNTEITKNENGDFVGTQSVSFFHLKSFNARSIQYPPDYFYVPAHIETIEVWKTIRGVKDAQLIASIAGKACNYFVNTDGSFYLVSLSFADKVDPVYAGLVDYNYGIYVAAAVKIYLYNADGTVSINGDGRLTNGYIEIFSPTSWRNQISPAAKNRTWSSINSVFQSIACDSELVRVGGVLAIEPMVGGENVLQFTESEFVVHEELTYYDFDPIDIKLVHFTSLANRKDESIPNGVPDVVQASGIPCDGEYWTSGSAWDIPNSYRYHSDSGCVGTGGIVDLKDQGISYGSIQRIVTWTTTLGKELNGAETWPCCFVWGAYVWDDTLPYDNPTYSNARCLQTYPSSPELGEIPSNSFCGLLIWYDYAKQAWNAIDMLVFTRYSNVSGTKGVKTDRYILCDMYGNIDSGVVYLPDQTVTYLGSGKTLAPYQQEFPNYWWYNWSESYSLYPWTAATHSSTGPDTITQAIPQVPSFSSHYTVGAYRKLHTEKTYINLSLFNQVALYSQRVVIDNNIEKDVKNYYKSFKGKESNVNIPGKHAKWCTNGRLLKVSKLEPVFAIKGESDG